MFFLMFVLPYTNGGYFLIRASDTYDTSASGYDYVEEETTYIPGCQAKKLSSGVACVKKSGILPETGEKSDPNCVKKWIRELSTKIECQQKVSHFLFQQAPTGHGSDLLALEPPWTAETLLEPF